MTPPDYLAIIDAKIARLQKLREELVELAAPVVIGTARPTALPAGKAEPRPVAAIGPGRSAVVPQLLRLLAARGPLQAADLAVALEIEPHLVSYHLKSKTALFRRQPGNRLAPWELTDAGRKAAAAQPPGA